MRQPCVYILASAPNGTLYVGVTANLARRISEHRQELTDSFTKRYGVTTLVHVEFHGTMEDAILREKRMKKWKREWKLQLIEDTNPTWRDIFNDFNN